MKKINGNLETKEFVEFVKQYCEKSVYLPINGVLTLVLYLKPEYVKGSDEYRRIIVKAIALLNDAGYTLHGERSYLSRPKTAKRKTLAMVYYGDYGQGKTAAAKCFIRDYFVNVGAFKPEATFKDVVNGVNWTLEYEGCWSPVLSIDATIDSNIETIKHRVQMFMKMRSIWNENGLKLKKFALFDEADRLGYAAQGALRSLLEKYPGTVTIYTTNKIESVDPAIVSRAAGGVFEFKKPTKDSLVDYLQEILRAERKTLRLSTIEEIAVVSQSVREAIGRLQQEIALDSEESEKL